MNDAFFATNLGKDACSTTDKKFHFLKGEGDKILKKKVANDQQGELGAICIWNQSFVKDVTNYIKSKICNGGGEHY